jgi:hypothetical protein
MGDILAPFPTLEWRAYNQERTEPHSRLALTQREIVDADLLQSLAIFIHLKL